MKIRNLTHYRTDDIRAIILPAIRKRLVEVPSGAKPKLYRDLLVKVGYGRRGQVTGWAYLGRVLVPSFNHSGGYMRLALPKERGNLNLEEELAWVAAHEADHVRGLNHKDMTCGGAGRIPGTWEHARTLTLRLKPQPDKTARAASRRDKRRTNARAKVAEWERKHKLAQTKLRTWKRRLKRLDDLS